MMTFDEAQAVVATKTAPKVTKDSIQARIIDTRYLKDGLTTIAIIELDNGFKVVGTSTPASAANYDTDVGNTYAYEDAFKKLWVLEGYLLKEKLFLEGLK